MARQSVSDDHEVYRVIVVKLPRVDNPDWVRGSFDHARFLYKGEPFEVAYGPYGSAGTARAQLTFRTLDSYGEPEKGVVGGRIEKASMTWEVVS
ncbi:hypothetical protein ACIQUY_04910 [Streptomyces sp. NPDC090231]|uniref:hypothetical protein n=1 Tax=unclassified Streptomyces TaxID=2593676 RepID=UPI003809DDEB